MKINYSVDKRINFGKGEEISICLYVFLKRSDARLNMNKCNEYVKSSQSSLEKGFV